MNEDTMTFLKYKMPDTFYKKFGKNSVNAVPRVGEIAYEPATGNVLIFNGSAFTWVAPSAPPAPAPTPAAPVPPAVTGPRRLILD